MGKGSLGDAWGDLGAPLGRPRGLWGIKKVIRGGAWGDWRSVGEGKRVKVGGRRSNIKRKRKQKRRGGAAGGRAPRAVSHSRVRALGPLALSQNGYGQHIT